MFDSRTYVTNLLKNRYHPWYGSNNLSTCISVERLPSSLTINDLV